MKFSIQVLLIFGTLSLLSGFALADGNTPTVGQSEDACSSIAQRSVKTLPASSVQGASSSSGTVDGKPAK